MNKTNSTPQEIRDAIMQHDMIVINMDSRFDYDALGSAYALLSMIKSIKPEQEVTCWFAEELPEKAKNLFDTSWLTENREIHQEDLTEETLYICADSGEWNKAINYKDIKRVKFTAEFMNLDHHAGNDMYGEYNYFFEYGSACAVIFQLYKELEIEPTDEALRYLAAGHFTDTSAMMYTKDIVDYDLHRELYLKGVDIQELLTVIMMSEHEHSVRYRGIVIDNLVVDHDKKIAYSTVSVDELSKFDIDTRNVFAAPDAIKYIFDLDFVFVIKENDIGQYSASFRSGVNKVMVLPIVKALGGGGHPGAASARFEADNIDAALEYVLQFIEDFQNK